MTSSIHLSTRRRRTSVALASALLAAALGFPGMSSAHTGGALHHPRVEQWRPLVEKYWGERGYADEVEYALMILYAESTGVATAVNPTSRASGLFQHLPKYWKERSRAAGWAGADIFDPEANIAVAAWLRATSPERGWKHWEPTHGRYPVGSWGAETRWDPGAGRYVNVGGGHLSLGGVFVESGPAPSLEVTKVARGDGELPRFEVGAPVSWSYVVTNTGESDLWALYLWDDQVGQVDCPDDSLAPGGTVSCKKVEAARFGEQRDRVIAFAWDDEGREASASAEGAYVGIIDDAVPSQRLAMRVVNTGWMGDPSRPPLRHYFLSNIGFEPLWAVFIWDDQLGEVPCPFDDLAPGESVACRATVPADAETFVTAWAWTDDADQLEVTARVPALGERLIREGTGVTEGSG